VILSAISSIPGGNRYRLTMMALQQSAWYCVRKRKSAYAGHVATSLKLGDLGKWSNGGVVVESGTFLEMSIAMSHLHQWLGMATELCPMG
jgi:hypothetical protein